MKKIIGLIFVMSFITQLHAGIFIEPGVGYNMLGGLTDSNSPASDSNVSGIGYYVKGGYKKLGFSVGLDYALSKLTLSDQVDKTNPDTDWNGSELGFFAGYDFPIMLRLWVGYVISAKIDFDGASKQEYMGNGLKFGVGYKVLPLLSLNLEYKAFTYDEEDDGAVAALVGPDEMSHKQILLSVSIPYSF